MAWTETWYLILGCVACAMVEVGCAGKYQRVGFGVFVLNVAGLDLANGEAYIDFILTVREEQRTFATYRDIMNYDGSSLRLCPNMTDTQDWQPWNGTSDDFFLVNMDRKGRLIALEDGQWRVKGPFYFRTNLASWPFETQTLEIIIELKDQIQMEDFNRVLCHITDYSGLSSSIRFPGDKFLSLTTSHSVRERCWPPFTNPDAVCTGSKTIRRDCACQSARVIYHNISDDFSCRCQGGRRISSRYSSMIKFNRPENTAFIKVFLPPLFIDLVVMLTYVLPVNHLDTRVSTCAATLIAAVLFHVSLQNQLPPTSTLTEADFLMIDVYIVNLFAWITTLILLLLKSAKHISERFTKRLYHFTRVLGPVLSISSFIMTFFHSLSNWWLWVLAALAGGLVAGLCLWLQTQLHNYLANRASRLKSRGKSRQRPGDTSVQMASLSSSSDGEEERLITT